jgi:hypothetical protein
MRGSLKVILGHKEIMKIGATKLLNVIYMGKILTNVENVRIEPRDHDYSSFQDLHHGGFNSTPRNYLIPTIYMSKFDGKDLITWIF